MEKQLYQEILNNEFVRRKTTNSYYSLRAFARDLDIRPSHLSRILKNERNISLEKAEEVSLKIFKTKKEREYFRSLVKFSIARTARTREIALKDIEKFEKNKNRITTGFDIINSISSWFHIALMELVTLKNIEQSDSNFSKILKISKKEVKDALQRLKRLKLITEKDNRLVKTNSHLKTTTNIPSSSIRKFHKSMIEKAIDSIDGQHISERYITSKTFAVSNSDLLKIQNEIEDFKDRVGDILNESKKESNKVYQLNIQLFNLIKNINK